MAANQKDHEGNDDGKTRCGWMGTDPVMLQYHDEEWGVPVHDDRKWFEFMVLDAFQAGLSWRTVLHKRAAFQEVFCGFDPERVACMSDRDVQSACENKAIIRNRMKIQAAIKNARVFLATQDKHGSFDSFLWSFTEGQVQQNAWKTLTEIPASTELSDRVSRALKQAGFSFVGSTICYAFLQSAGVVNDHLVHCFRHGELGIA